MLKRQAIKMSHLYVVPNITLLTGLFSLFVFISKGTFFKYGRYLITRSGVYFKFWNKANNKNVEKKKPNERIHVKYVKVTIK